MSYFAPDCFHFSIKGHNAAGKGLWNNVVSYDKLKLLLISCIIYGISSRIAVQVSGQN